LKTVEPHSFFPHHPRAYINTELSPDCFVCCYLSTIYIIVRKVRLFRCNVLWLPFSFSICCLIHFAGGVQGWDGWDETSLEPVQQLLDDEQDVIKERWNKHLVWYHRLLRPTRIGFAIWADSKLRCRLPLFFPILDNPQCLCKRGSKKPRWTLRNSKMPVNQSCLRYGLISVLALPLDKISSNWPLVPSTYSFTACSSREAVRLSTQRRERTLVR